MHPKEKKLPLTEFTELSTDNSNPKSIPKDAYGYDAITTYLSLDNLGINALPDSEKYKRGIKENRTGRTRTLGIWMECPNPDCKSKNFSIIMHDKDTVFYPNNALKGSHSMALLF
jgi:hypothetical protein